MSSSDYLARRRYLITEKNEPRPCCTDTPIYVIANGTTRDLSDTEFVIVAETTLAPTIEGIAIVSGNLNVDDVAVGEEITMRLTYGLVGETILLPTHSGTATANGSIGIAGVNETPVLSVGTTYTFMMQAKSSSNTTIAVSSASSKLIVIANVRQS